MRLKLFSRIIAKNNNQLHNRLGIPPLSEDYNVSIGSLEGKMSKEMKQYITYAVILLVGVLAGYFYAQSKTRVLSAQISELETMIAGDKQKIKTAAEKAKQTSQEVAAKTKMVDDLKVMVAGANKKVEAATAKAQELKDALAAKSRMADNLKLTSTENEKKAQAAVAKAQKLSDELTAKSGLVKQQQTKIKQLEAASR